MIHQFIFTTALSRERLDTTETHRINYLPIVRVHVCVCAHAGVRVRTRWCARARVHFVTKAICPADPLWMKGAALKVIA